MNIHEQIEALSAKIAELARQQSGLSRQLLTLMDELDALKKQAGSAVNTSPPKAVEVKEIITPTPVPVSAPPPPPPPPPSPKPKQQRSTLEEFIGGNLASKAGILITIIGIFIGAKYAIEHNLVRPVVRVTSGYVSGLVLIGVAIRLRKKYEQYSSVLMGGGLAVLYFITYIAYSFYGMLPQLTAFGLMLLFTVATVYAALLYNRIIIAHLGLIGAYAIPILLSDNSGRYAVLFSYIAIINTGILILSFRKYWKSLFYVSFVFTWAIYSVWAAIQYNSQQHFDIAITFLLIYFLIFYITFLAYKLIKKEQYSISDVILLLSNAFIFYGFGYWLLDDNGMDHLLGAFTLGNAVLHLVVSFAIKKMKLADKALFYLLLGLVIAFLTIAIPVQLDGNWVTLLWTAEAVLVFVVGRTQQRVPYEKLGVAVILLSFLSLLGDWWERSGDTPFLNVVFVTGIFVALAQAAIIYLHQRKAVTGDAMYLQFYSYILPGIFLATTYFAFELELNFYLERLAANVRASSILLYTMVFIALVAYVNQQWVKNKLLGAVTVLATVFSLIFLLLDGLSIVNQLPESYLLLRYSVIGATAMLLALANRSVKLYLPGQTIKITYAVSLQITIVAILSFEYLYWAGRSSTNDNEYKLGLSILWSVYALGLVILGISKKKKHWRLTGICFFIITVIKLFMYDLNQTTTISKTVSFISLGAILLLVSYLYNRYKDVILANDESS